MPDASGRPGDTATWEERMSLRAQARRAADGRMQDELERAAREAEDVARDAAYLASPDSRLYVGSCDVCGQRLELRHSYTLDGIIDIGIDDGPDGEQRVYTWRRHGADGPLQPDCDLYFSRVYEVRQGD